MAQLRIALTQIDPTVGDLAGNADRSLTWTRHAAEQGAHLVAFPEMVLTGYPVEDLALRSSFVEASSAAAAARSPRGSPTRASASCRSSSATSTAPSARRRARPARRGARTTPPRCCTGGEVVLTLRQAPPAQLRRVRRVPLLRAAATRCRVVRVHGVDVALAICEDLWQDGGRVPAPAPPGPGCCSRSTPRRTSGTRTTPAWSWCASARPGGRAAPLAYLAMIGGQDELVFDGDSIVVDADGEVVARAPQFAEELLVARPGPAGRDRRRRGVPSTRATARPAQSTASSLVDEPVAPYEPELTGGVAERLDDDEEVYSALVVGRARLRAPRTASASC